MILVVLLCFRYANVDYVVVRSTEHNPEPKKIASYDIMCQWSKNLRKRLSEFPHGGAESLDDKIVARMVPKFHLAAHRQECRANYSLNYEPGAGRRDMEGVMDIVIFRTIFFELLVFFTFTLLTLHFAY